MNRNAGNVWLTHLKLKCFQRRVTHAPHWAGLTDNGSLQINTHLHTHTNKTETHKSAMTLSIFKNERHMDSQQRKVLFALREDGRCNKTSSKSVLESKLNTEGFLRSPQDKSDWHWSCRLPSCGLLLFLCLLVFLHGRCCAGENAEYLFHHIFLKVFNQLCCQSVNTTNCSGFRSCSHNMPLYTYSNLIMQHCFPICAAIRFKELHQHNHFFSEMGSFGSCWKS